MKLAETVTFGGSGLNRAGALRGQAEGRPEIGDKAIVFWRGKVLIEKSETPRLLRVDVGHPEFSHGCWAFWGLMEPIKSLLLISRTGHLKRISIPIQQYFMIPLNKYTQISQMRPSASCVVRWRS